MGLLHLAKCSFIRFGQPTICSLHTLQRICCCCNGLSMFSSVLIVSNLSLIGHGRLPDRILLPLALVDILTNCIVKSANKKISINYQTSNRVQSKESERASKESERASKSARFSFSSRWLSQLFFRFILLRADCILIPNVTWMRREKWLVQLFMK